MNKVGGIAYAIVAVLALMLFIDSYENPFYYFYDHSSSSTGMFAFGLAATAFATIGPIAFSLYCWRLANRVRLRWAVHLLFLPCACAMFFASAWVLESASAQPPWADDHAIELLGVAFLLLAFTLLVHAGAMIFEIVAAIRRPRGNPS
ncbi:hypothetical protein C7I55_13195 [Sphingomonas deserti]|uniref:Inner membrane protein n=2 Tax=Allosphingosinicella deserti TaxID=2116704 RepID=A0A2P7QNM6_9SPHN|nr:hypothetical protein C7I55_13195 [Sphingomonas deserti]